MHRYALHMQKEYLTEADSIMIMQIDSHAWGYEEVPGLIPNTNINQR